MAVGKKTKIFLVLILAAIALVCIVGVVAAANLSRVVKAVVPPALSRVLQVDVTLEDADVSLLGGSVMLKGLVIGNPEGFKTKSAFQLDEVKVKISLKSLRTDEPTVQLVSPTKDGGALLGHPQQCYGCSPRESRHGGPDPNEFRPFDSTCVLSNVPLRKPQAYQGRRSAR